LPSGNGLKILGTYGSNQITIHPEQTEPDLYDTDAHEEGHSLADSLCEPWLRTEIGADIYSTMVRMRPCDRQNYHLYERAA
jgi:hypothetical protein